MPKTYLTTSYLERTEAKDLGARWDGGLSKWYVPEGCDLAPFSKWLPPGAAPTSTSTVVAAIQTGNASLAVASKNGVRYQASWPASHKPSPTPTNPASGPWWKS